MTTLTVTGYTDFSGTVLSSIDKILFTGTAGRATAVFSSVQFNGLQINQYTNIVGSAEPDMFIVNIAEEDYISPSSWTFSNWSTDDILIVNGTSGNDEIKGTDKNDILKGGHGFDLLLGGCGNDRLNGGDGDDELIAGFGSDTVIGGDGNDKLLADEYGDPDPAAGTINRMYGGDGEDFFESGAGHDLMYGGAGDDEFEEESDMLTSGDDVYWGGAGNDSLLSRSGADLMHGGTGVDIIFLDRNSYTSNASGLVVDIGGGGKGRDIGDGTRLWGIERLCAYGGAGSDTFTGGNRNDELSGGIGEDVLNGGGDDDQLYGGADRDILSGGEGADEFIFSSTVDSKSGSQRDVILDFEHGIDAIVLKTAYWRSSYPNLDIEYIGQTKFSGARDEIRYEYTKAGNTIVSIDLDRDAIADFEIKLIGEVKLTAFDFEI